MEGFEKIKKEALEMNDSNVNDIVNYLEKRTDMYENYNKEEKSVNQMYEFIYNKAHKQAKNNVAMVMDNIVYLWAITYFSKSNDELGIKEKKVMPPTANEVIENISKKEKEQKKEETTEQITMFQEEEK